MYKDPSSGGSSTASRKGDEVELVNRFLAPLCARDEAARNIALAAARTTVEGWLGGVGSPNNNREITTDLEDKALRFAQCNNSPLKVAGNANYRMQLRDSFTSDGFFAQSVSEGAATIFARKTSFDANLTPERYSSGSFDCVDGKTNDANFEYNGGTSSHESRLLNYRLKEAENHFGSSSDSERRFFASNEGLNESCLGQEEKQRANRHYTRIKSGRQQQFNEEDEDADTRIYGKSPKFDDEFGNLEFRSRKFRDNSDDYYETSLDGDKVVFNTLDGFLNEGKSKAESSSEEMKGGVETAVSCDYAARSNVPGERKLSAGQIKRPLSQDEDVPWNNGRTLESPAEVVTPGDVGRMLNLGNALDGPRQAQANKYLSLVSLHLPVILRLSVNCPFRNVRIKCTEIIQMIKDRGLPVPEPAFDGPSAFVPVSEVAANHRSSCLRKFSQQVKMTQMLLQEPGWKLERKGSALLLRRDSTHQRAKTQRVCFRCDVEVREYERDEDYYPYEVEPTEASSPLAMCASCLAAICVTVVLPWLLIGG